MRMFSFCSPARWRGLLIVTAAVAMLGVAAFPVAAGPWSGDRNRFASPRFEQVWGEADLPVLQGRAARSWTWGPQPWFDYREVYQQAPNGLRQVQYFDKARMEINDPRNTGGPLGGVTNGLLVVELVSGRLKLGNGTGPDQNQARQPSTIPVAGDLPPLGGGGALPTPSYADFRGVATTDNGYRDPSKIGQRIGTTLGGDGATGFNQELADRPGVDIVAYEPVTGHNIPRVFDDFLRASPVSPLVAFGYPITDPYWITARVAGQERPVLVQLFERRSLTYTPNNPPGFLVEMGNVGQHYFLWRYPGLGLPWAAADPGLPITFSSKRDGGDFLTYRMDAAGLNQERIGGPQTALLPSSQIGWWSPELPQYYTIYGDTTAYTGKRQVAVLVPQAPFRNLLLGSDANDYQPAISPDGTQLAFVSDRDGNPDLYLFLFEPAADIRSHRVVRLTDTRDCANEHPAWLPDGSGLVFDSNCQGGNWEIYRGTLSYTLQGEAQPTVANFLTPGTNGSVRLTNNTTSDRWPRVSPDGSMIAFVSSRDNNNEIYAMNVDGSGQSRLTNDNARDEGPAWSPDSRRVVFNSDRDGDHEIFVVNVDGSSETQLTLNNADDGYAVWSP